MILLLLFKTVLAPLSHSESNSQENILTGDYYRDIIKPGITLNVLPRQAISWEEFCRFAPPYSIALDGFVKSGPRIDFMKKHANFDHHSDVNRLFTACTSQQVKLALDTGLADAFKVDGRFTANLFVNDPDHDTSLAVWLLSNFTNGISERQRQRVRKLVEAEQLMDSTGGTYPVKSSRRFLEQMAWMFEPYSNARNTGQLRGMGAPQMAQVITDICERISLFVDNQASRVSLDTRYIVLDEYPDWSLIEEIGADARSGYTRAGVKVFVACRRNDDETFTYSIGRLGPFVDFPLQEIDDALNAAEGILPNEKDCWGGSDLILGSPRIRGSKLAPNQAAQVINEVLARRKIGR